MERVSISRQKWLKQRERNVPLVPFEPFWNESGTLQESILKDRSGDSCAADDFPDLGKQKIISLLSPFSKMSCSSGQKKKIRKNEKPKVTSDKWAGS